MSRKSLLQRSLFAGAIYFLGVAIAHMSIWKIPFLYIYYNIPSHAYQDRVISILAFGWSVFMVMLSRDTTRYMPLILGIVGAGATAIAGLCVINFSTDFSSVAPDVNTNIFWLETALLAGYVSFLAILVYAVIKDSSSPASD